MIDFVGRSRSPLDDMQQWNQYFGQQTDRAQSEWQQRELRRRYDEANRYNREGAISDRQFQTQSAGQLQSEDSTLAGLRPAEAPARLPDVRANAGLDAAAMSAPTAANLRGRGPGEIMMGRDFNQSLPTGDVRVDMATPTMPQPAVPETQMNSSQRTAWRTLRQTYNQVVQKRAGPEAYRRALRSAIMTGAVTSQGTEFDQRGRTIGNTDATVGVPNATAPIPAPVAGTGTPLDVTAPNPEDTGAPIQLDDTTGTPSNPGGLEPPDAQGNFNSSANVSRVVRPTREMRMLEITRQDNLRRADLAAAHGDRAGAQAAFAQALQAQAAYTQQYRMALYQAAQSGNQDAMSELLSEFNLQASVDAQGNWTNGYGMRMDRQTMLGQLQNLVDAAGAAARTEANTEYMRAQIAANAQITVATIEHRAAIFRALTDAQIHQMDNEAQAALHDGEGRMLINNDNGEVYFEYATRDAQGRRVPRVEVIRMEDVPTASTQGNRTVRAPTRTEATRVTGTVGTEANN